jgi:regulator of protease activity HflC (stomatin/prohibitin superfamily)
MKKLISCFAVAAAFGSAGCATTTVEPGHRGLYFAQSGGLRREVLQPGRYNLGICVFCASDRIDDFDVTYSTKEEEIVTKSNENLDMHLKLSVIYRPIVSELYALETEIGSTNYYGEVIAPEFRSACRGVFSRHSYTELQRKNEAIENEVEAELRRRTAGRHVEISSVTLESVEYAPEIAEINRRRIAAETETSRKQSEIAAQAELKKQVTESEAAQKTLELETAAARQKLEVETAAAQKKLELQAALEEEKLTMAKDAEAARFKADQVIAQVEMQKKVSRAEAEMARFKAESEAQQKVIEARADSEAGRLMAKAHAEEQRAQSAGMTPLDVMMHAYDALGHLGGTGTTIVLGDWAHVPNFLFPRVPSLQSAFTLPWSPYVPSFTPPAAAPPPATSMNDDGRSPASPEPGRNQGAKKDPILSSAAVRDPF